MIGYGDEILAAGQAERLHHADPSCRVAITDIDGIPRWHDIWEGNPILARPSDVARGEVVHRLQNGPQCRPYIIYPFTDQTGWMFNPAFHAREYIAKIYLTEQECARGERARQRYGPYVLIEPYTKHANLRWPFSYYCALVASRPDLTFVQHTHAGSTLVPGAHPEPATFREACGLVAASSVYIRSESGMLHAAAALSVTTIAIWGGCMDWDVLGSYPREIGVGIDRSPAAPCGRWLPCDHCQRTMAAITPEQVGAVLSMVVDARGMRTG